MRKIIENKKGDIPVTILVIGVFAICSLAILTFFVSDFRISNSFVGLEVMDKLNTLSQEYKFYSSEKDSIEDLNNYFGWTEENGIRYFELEKTYMKTNFKKFKREEVLLFSVKMPVPN